MAKVTINENTCKGCELCTTACPKHIISLAKDKLNLKGYHPACVTNPRRVHRMCGVRYYVSRLCNNC